MATQTLTPKYINFPKEGKTYGSVKLANGNRLVGKPEVLGMMTVGKTYEVETTEQNWTDGVVHVIVKATLANGHAHQTQQPTEQFKRQPTPEIDSERMYTCGIVNALVPEIYKKFGSITPDQIVAVTQAARFGWASTFGKKDDERE